MNQVVNGCPKLASIILAGGEGQRLRSLTAEICGTEMPKQFCRVLGKETLLEQTLNRVGLTIPPWRTVTVLTRAHRDFYGPLVGETPGQQLAIQPENRGITAAILYGLTKIGAIDSRAIVAIFPSDHYFSDDLRLMRHVEMAARAAWQMPSNLVLLGVSPDRPDISYGWIEPDTIVQSIESVPIYSVRSFWEKPPFQIARYLHRSGALWNTLVIVAQLRALNGLLQSAEPGMQCAFHRISSSMNTDAEADSIEKVYQSLTSSDFSRDILGKSTTNLAALAVTGLEWSDLGEPRRVHFVRRKLGRDIECEPGRFAND
jgi:mannose-1-phosphate guanylyltransferase